jgi:beta propeller repeat protein
VIGLRQLLSVGIPRRLDQHHRAPEQVLWSGAAVLLLSVIVLGCGPSPTEPLLGSQAIVVGDGFLASLSGSLVVWVPHTGPGSPLSLLDLSSGESRELVSSGGPAQLAEPSIDGSRVAWISALRDSSGAFTFPVYFGDIQGDPPLEIAQGEMENAQPDVSGERVVWEREHPDHVTWDVLTYDAGTGDTTLVASNTGPFPDPAIDGDWIVYSQVVSYTDTVPLRDIMLYDLATGERRKVSETPKLQGNVDISGDIVVWAANYGGGADIWYRNLATGELVDVTAGAGHGAFPSISGSRIVWQDSRYVDDDIYLYDIRTGRQTRITDAPGNQVYPSISGDWVVWGDQGRVPWKIMALHLP